MLQSQGTPASSLETLSYPDASRMKREAARETHKDSHYPNKHPQFNMVALLGDPAANAMTLIALNMDSGY